MENDFFKELTAFDLTKIKPGDAIQLIEPSHDVESYEKVKNCLVKKISPISITLVIGSIVSNSEGFEYEYEFTEKEFPIEAFHGVGCYTLKNIVKAK